MLYTELGREKRIGAALQRARSRESKKPGGSVARLFGKGLVPGGKAQVFRIPERGETPKIPPAIQVVR